MIMLIDCPKCGIRTEWNTDDREQRCARCKTMDGRDVKKILVELRKAHVPGQEPILHLIDLLDRRLGVIEHNLDQQKNVKEAKLNVDSSDAKQN